jgi:hypothetical protein
MGFTFFQLKLKQHSETQTHKKKSKSVLSSSQSKLVVTKSQTTSFANSSQLGISTQTAISPET